jgi:hypothetical protein
LRHERFIPLIHGFRTLAAIRALVPAAPAQKSAPASLLRHFISDPRGGARGEILSPRRCRTGAFWRLNSDFVGDFRRAVQCLHCVTVTQAADDLTLCSRRETPSDAGGTRARR